MQEKFKYLNEKETSQLTGIALSTLRNHRSKSCGLPYVKIGKSVRYSFQDIIEYFEGHKVTHSEV
jgi:predicted DNA-binding transcriptional regulator AlpA